MTTRNNNRGVLSYRGVAADQPPEVIRVERAPTQDDISFSIHTMWINPYPNDRIYMLLDKRKNSANWVQIYPVGDSPGIQNVIMPQTTTNAVPDNGNITLRGGLGLQARATGTHEFQIEPDVSVTGNVFLSGQGYKPVTSPNGSISVAFTNAGLELEVAAGFSGGTDNFATDAGDAQPDGTGEITISGGDNINTEATGSNEVTVNLDEAIYLPATTGSTSGVYGINSNPVLHSFGGFGNTNIFVGHNSGNFSFTSCSNNAALGTETLDSITNNAIFNTAIGSATLRFLREGSRNVALGANAGNEYDSNESDNVLLYTRGITGDNNTIRIGNSSIQNRAFIAGTHGVTPAGTDIQQVTIDSNGQLGSTTAGTVSNVVSDVITDSGTAQPNASNEIQVLGGSNINTEATGNNEITVRTNDAIFLAGTAGGSSTGQSAGVYGIGNAPVMHTYGDETNFFAGVDAGNFTMSSSINNVGVGAAALGVIANDANGNVGVGSGTLENLVDGDGNIAIGNFAGTSYNTNESENILLRSTGSTGENNTIRIGEPTIHTRAFMAGVHDVNQPDETGLQYVTINSSGQLGTTDYSGGDGIASARVDIFTHLENDLPIPQKAGGTDPSTPSSFIFFGATQALIEDRDDGNDFFPGDGAGNEATFTVPRDGNYSFYVALNNATTPVASGTRFKYSMPTCKIVRNTVNNGNVIANIGMNEYIPDSPSAAGIEKFTSQASNQGPDGVNLTAGDVIRFCVGISHVGTDPKVGGGQEFTGSSTYRTQIVIKENWSTGF